MSAVLAAPRTPVAAVPPARGGVRLVLLGQLLLWARRQALDLRLGALRALVVAGALLAAMVLPGLGALVGRLAVGASGNGLVVVGGVLIVLATWCVGRLLATLPTSRRLAVQKPPDRLVFQALGSHPEDIRTALATVPAAAAAVAAVLATGGVLVGVGGVEPLHWLTALVLPVSAAAAEARLLRLPPVRTRPSRVIAPLALLAGGWTGGAVIADLAGRLAWPPSDESVVAAIGWLARQAAAAAPVLLAASALLFVVVVLPWPDAVAGAHMGRTPSHSRPSGRVVRLSLRRDTGTAVVTHRRLSRAAWLGGLVVLGAGTRLLGTPGLSTPAVRLATLGLLSAAAMALSISLASGLGVRTLECALRWRHDSGVAAVRVAGSHLAESCLALVGPLTPAIVGAALLTGSVAVALAAVAVTAAAVATATLGDLLDSTRTRHADGSGESGIIGGLLTAVLQAVLTTPWAWLLLGQDAVAGGLAGVTAPLLALVLACLLTVRRLHP